jgi:hypothetical protein
MNLPPCFSTISSGPHLKAKPMMVKASNSIILEGKSLCTTLATSSPKVILLLTESRMVDVETRDLCGLNAPHPSISVNYIAFSINYKSTSIVLIREGLLTNS